mgnify:CR=1 FL=1
MDRVETALPATVSVGIGVGESASVRCRVGSYMAAEAPTAPSQRGSNHYRRARAAPTAISRIRQILDGGRKVKDMGKAKVVDDIADAKIVDDVAEETVKRSGNIFTRNPVTTTAGGLLLGAGVAPSLLGGGEEETTKIEDKSSDESNEITGPIDLSGVPNETIGVYARKILQQKGFFFNNESVK